MNDKDMLALDVTLDCLSRLCIPAQFRRRLNIRADDMLALSWEQPDIITRKVEMAVNLSPITYCCKLDRMGRVALPIHLRRLFGVEGRSRIRVECHPSAQQLRLIRTD